MMKLEQNEFVKEQQAMFAKPIRVIEKDILQFLEEGKLQKAENIFLSRFGEFEDSTLLSLTKKIVQCAIARGQAEISQRYGRMLKRLETQSI